MSQTLRCFLAFDLPQQIRQIIDKVHEDLVKTPLDVKWVKPRNIHLTVVFLGNVAVENFGPLGQEVEKACIRYAPFDIALRGIGVFGGLNSPRVIWIGLQGDVKRMGIFRDAISKRMARFGIEREKRPFRPHLTLGRFRKGARGGALLREILEKYGDLDSPHFRVDKLTLFRSDLSPQGARYTKISLWPLRGDK